MWFGGLGGLTVYAEGKLTNYTTKEGLVGNYVRSIYEDAEGTLWIGTYGEGMSRFKNGKFVNYRAKDGLYNDGVFAIEEDARGNFWISSNRGIYRVKRRELNEFAEGKIARIGSVGYGTGDGMRSSECNGGRQPASLTDKDGRFWFPTQDGVVVIEPGNERANDLPPSVVIESATVERESADIRRGVIVPPGRENVEINYTGISLIKSEQIRFRHKLEGHDPDWIDAGTRRTAYYSYLPPGQYRFRRHRRQQRRRVEREGGQPRRRVPAVLLPDPVVLPDGRHRGRGARCSAPGECARNSSSRASVSWRRWSRTRPRSSARPTRSCRISRIPTG